MAQNFLGALADQISSQFSLGENNTHTLDAVIDGQNVKYGALGDLAGQIDQSAERRYVEEGYLRRDPYNSDPKQLEILMQEPNATVFIKKKMFSSIAENFRPDFMDAEEKLYYKAIKILFQNKCKQIAALEKLSKIEKISSAVGKLDAQLMPVIFGLTDVLDNGIDTGSSFLGASTSFGSSNPFSKDHSKLTRVMDRVRRVYAFNTTNKYTTWIADATNLFESQFGQGTGVIEITNFTNLSTNTTVDISNPGSISLSIVDPYETTLITEYDIERAIADATNSFYNHRIFQFGITSADTIIENLTTQLNQARQIRKASPITIKTDPDTLLGKRVTAILDRLGIEIGFTYGSPSGTGGPLAFPGLGGAFDSVRVEDEYLRGGSIAGFDGLDTRNTNMGPDQNIRRLKSESELSLFKRLIAAIFNKMQLIANSQNAAQLGNQDTNYVRRKMRFNFSGKLIIQPMDTVNVYINSKSRYDNRILSGLNSMMTGVGILQNINNTLTDLTGSIQSFATLFGQKAGNNANIPFQIEKSVYVGSDFPDYLWNLMRNQFVTENEGTHVFGGVITGATDNWQDGRFTIDVRGQDNTYYFEQGKINFKPGMDVYNGSIFDPLTPFESKFDQITGSTGKDKPPVLLKENKFLLGTSGKESLLRYKLGTYAGQKATSANYIGDHSLDPKTGLITRVFYAPDGLVYKWKEGIGVFTQFGSSLLLNDADRVGSPNLYGEPFAGHDIMNVLSLLIAGVPYNFATYYKGLGGNGNPSYDPQSKQNASYSFINSLQQSLTKSNSLWGNFIPFKNLVMDEQSYIRSLRAQFLITQNNQELDEKLRKLEELNNTMRLRNAAKNAFDDNGFGDDFPDLRSQVNKLTENITGQIKEIKDKNKVFYDAFNTNSDADFGQLLDANKIGAQASDPNLRRFLRRKLNYLTRRMSYEVRANDDRNLLVIDDFYDKDYDIAAYSQQLSDGVKLYNNEYTSVKEKIANVAGLLNLEVFCDTQGHIRIRPPQYNRMPSSVFYRMMHLKKAYGIQVFPQFMDDLFSTQLDTIKTRVEIIEDQIRLYCAILGKNSDSDATKFINGSTASNLKGAPFSFVSDSTGTITSTSNATDQANPDLKESRLNFSFDNFEVISAQSKSTKNLFPNTQRYSIIFDALQQQLSPIQDGINLSDVASVTANSYVDDLKDRIQTKSGVTENLNDYLTPSSTESGGLRSRNIDIFKVTQDISTKVQERQAALKLMYNTIKNVQEYRSLDGKDGSRTASRLLTPGIYGNSHIPEVFEHMIEDESLDDYGVGSGTRYIIKRSQIRNINISENPPPFTAVEVQGTIPYFATNVGPDGLNSFPGGGNAVVTAMAVDYDMWRTYGFKEGSVIKVPFLSDGASQCGPYASMILSRNRKNILRGTVTISGNEFMQPGEVVFLQDRGMLFYVTSVRHSFTFGGSFTTTLELSYGHTPGEYIPTTMDIIGKLIYRNRDIAEMVVQRQENSNNETSVGAVIHKTNQKTLNKDKPDANSTWENFNNQVLENILYNCAAIINSNDSKNNDVAARIELRLYYDNKTGGVDFELGQFAQEVKKFLTTPANGSTAQNSKQKTNNIVPTINKDRVSIVTVNMDQGSGDTRSPSQKAIDHARNLMASQSSSAGANASSNDKLRKQLFSYIVDCWLVIEPASTTSINGL